MKTQVRYVALLGQAGLSGVGCRSSTVDAPTRLPDGTASVDVTPPAAARPAPAVPSPPIELDAAGAACVASEEAMDLQM